MYKINTLDEFNDLPDDIPVTIKVSAPDCGPCMLIQPKWNRLANDLTGLASFVEIDASVCDTEILTWLNVRSVPLFVVYQDGEILESGVGASNHSLILGYIDWPDNVA